jgi:hypothetical protein
LERHGLLAAGVRLGDEDLGKALDVRAGLRALLAADGGAEIDADAVHRLDEVAVEARPRIRFRGDGTYRF